MGLELQGTSAPPPPLLKILATPLYIHTLVVVKLYVGMSPSRSEAATVISETGMAVPRSSTMVKSCEPPGQQKQKILHYSAMPLFYVYVLNDSYLLENAMLMAIFFVI